MILKVNHENMPAISQYGHKILCDGYVIKRTHSSRNPLNFNIFLCDDHAIKLQKSIFSQLIKRVCKINCVS